MKKYIESEINFDFDNLPNFQKNEYFVREMPKTFIQIATKC